MMCFLLEIASLTLGPRLGVSAPWLGPEHGGRWPQGELACRSLKYIFVFETLSFPLIFKSCLLIPRRLPAPPRAPPWRHLWGSPPSSQCQEGAGGRYQTPPKNNRILKMINLLFFGNMSANTCPEWKTFPSSSTYSEVIMAQLDLEKEKKYF